MDSKKFSEKSDEELVKLSLELADHYLALMERYEAKLIRYILRISNLTKEDAEDVLQETFVSAYQNLQGFDFGFKFSSWIYRIAHNKTISYIRKINARPKSIDIEDRELIDNIIIDKDFEDVVHNEILKEKIIDAIATLDIRYKSPMVLRFLEGKEYSEISDILKIPVNSVGTLINRGKKILRDKLK